MKDWATEEAMKKAGYMVCARTPLIFNKMYMQVVPLKAYSLKQKGLVSGLVLGGFLCFPTDRVPKELSKASFLFLHYKLKS